MTKNMRPMNNFTSLSGIGKALIVAAVFFVAGCGERISREDFAAMVKDKSTTEVQARHGKPDAVDESVPGTVKWTYTSKTFTTGESTKMDTHTVLVFARNDANAPAKVVEVLYP
jgi:hypothetical protein